LTSLRFNSLIRANLTHQVWGPVQTCHPLESKSDLLLQCGGPAMIYTGTQSGSNYSNPSFELRHGKINQHLGSGEILNIMVCTVLHRRIPVTLEIILFSFKKPIQMVMVGFRRIKVPFLFKYYFFKISIQNSR
jgi:hypothetical protein